MAQGSAATGGIGMHAVRRRAAAALAGLVLVALMDFAWSLSAGALPVSINDLLTALTGTEGMVWLSDPDVALLAVAITDIWMWSPFVMLLSLAGLSAIPPSLYEAAAIDRASRWFVFWRITLPLVAPLLLIAVIFRTMEAFKTFDVAYVMTSMDETELVAIRLYKMAFLEWQTGRSCALAYLMLLAVLAITNVYVKYLNRLKER